MPERRCREPSSKNEDAQHLLHRVLEGQAEKNAESVCPPRDQPEKEREGEGERERERERMIDTGKPRFFGE